MIMTKTDTKPADPASAVAEIEAWAKLAREAAGVEIAEIRLSAKGLPESVPIAKLPQEAG
jgi:hypothetical protein